MVQETRTADCGDARLDRRDAPLRDRLRDKPSFRIPAACLGPAETGAAYRFFDNERVRAQQVLQPHHAATLERIRQEPVVLIPQDTTERELPRRQQQGGGPRHAERRWGLFAHPPLALTPPRLPLGVSGAPRWRRDAAAFAKSPADQRRVRRAKSLEAKERVRWRDG